MTVTTPRPISTLDGDTEALFKEARRRRRRRWVSLGCLLAVSGLVAVLFATSGGSPPKRPKSARREGGGSPSTAVVGHLILRGDGIGNARFGQAETVAIGELRTRIPPTDLCRVRALIGPTIRVPRQSRQNCSRSLNDVRAPCPVESRRTLPSRQRRFLFGASVAMSGTAGAVGGASVPWGSPTVTLAWALASIASGSGFSESSGSGTASLSD